MNNYLAYADAAGVITITGEAAESPAAPNGCLPIATHAERSKLESVLQTVGRHAYDNVTLLVPGVPEAETPDQALDSLIAFRARVEQRLAA